jgi:hypothetical protein
MCQPTTDALSTKLNVRVKDVRAKGPVICIMLNASANFCHEEA